MRRRSRASSKLANARSRKAEMPKRRSAPVARGSSSKGGQETKAARLTRERDEALERETANSEILRLISTSPGDLELVCLGASTRKQRTVFSPSALAAS